MSNTFFQGGKNFYRGGFAPLAPPGYRPEQICRSYIYWVAERVALAGICVALQMFSNATLIQGHLLYFFKIFLCGLSVRATNNQINAVLNSSLCTILLKIAFLYRNIPQTLQ